MCGRLCSKHDSCENYYISNSNICILGTNQTGGITENDVSATVSPDPGQIIMMKSRPVVPTPVAVNVINRAQGRPAEQSSTWQSKYGAAKAVDGCYGTDLATVGCECTFTNHVENPWWSVDLEATTSVSSIVITNRDDPQTLRLHDFDVIVSTDNIDPNLATDSTLCHHYTGGFLSGATESVVCDQPVTGRYVTISLTNLDYLILCEVEVY